jgi:hypothetical protein
VVGGKAYVSTAHEDRRTHVKGYVITPDTGATTTGYVMLFDDEHPDASVGQHGGRGQTADPGPDDYHVVTIPYDSVCE